MMPRESGRLRRRLAIVTALLFGSASGASLTSLSARDADKMKSVLYGGACWVVACTDADDKGTGQSLLERAMDDADASKACSGATLKCDAKLPSGKSTRARLGIAKPPEGYPLLFVAANGEARAVAVEEYAVVDGQTATPDHRRLAKHVADAGAPPRPTMLASAADFKARCAEKRHCLAVFVNGSRSDAAALRGFKQAAAKLARTRRTLRVVVADAKTLGSFSLAKALPGGAATALYLRRLNANEKAVLAAAAAKLPAAKRDGAAFDASACGAGAVLAKSADDADRNFEAKRLAPRDWAGAGDAAEKLVFRSSGVYLSYGAAALALAEQALFGAAPTARSLKALAAKRPLAASSKPPLLGAKAFRGGDFGAEAVGAWVDGMTAAATDDLAFLRLGLTGLPKAPKFSKAGAPSPRPTRRPSPRPTPRPARTPTKPPTKAAKAQAARDKAEARAEREREARAKMEADAEEHIPQTVDISDDGDASWHVDDGDGDDEDDDDEDDDEDEDYEMI